MMLKVNLTCMADNDHLAVIMDSCQNLLELVEIEVLCLVDNDNLILKVAAAKKIMR